MIIITRVCEHATFEYVRRPTAKKTKGADDTALVESNSLIYQRVLENTFVSWLHCYPVNSVQEAAL